MTKHTGHTYKCIWCNKNMTERQIELGYFVHNLHWNDSGTIVGINDFNDPIDYCPSCEKLVLNLYLKYQHGNSGFCKDFNLKEIFQHLKGDTND